MTSRAEVDALDAAYLDLAAEAAGPRPHVSDPIARARHDSLTTILAAAAVQLVDAITDHDLAHYGELLPETPCTANQQP